jgi:exopolysaccharide biosynthesis polyprenyl glycosylphosphotransferase
MKNRGQNELFSTQILQVFDALIVWLSFVLAAALHPAIRGFAGMGTGDDDGLENMMWIVYIVVPLTPLILEKFEFYERIATKKRAQVVNELFQSILLVGLIVALVAVVFRFSGTRRLIFGTGLFCTFGFLWLRSAITRRVLRAKAERPENLDHVVLAGNKEEIDSFLEEVETERLQTWRIVSHFDMACNTVDQLGDLIKKKAVQRVVFLTRHTEFERVSRAVGLCEIQGVEAWLGASFLKTQVARPTFDVIGGQPMLVFRSTPELSWQLFAKQMLDFFGAGLILLCTLPLWVLAWVGIKLASPGAPVFFSQKRSGLYGKAFSIYKFRTMVPDAEARLKEVKESHGNELDGPAFKLDADPRIFPFGSFLRKYSIDELPQLINVIKGEMSLVGPRPLPVHEIEAIENSAHRRRLSMKPGLTCIWQITGRSNITDFDEWVKLDTRYIDDWSIWGDVLILLKTVPAVLFGKGAK